MGRENCVDAYRKGRAGWPDIELSRESFENHLRRVGYGPRCIEHVTDLYLCAAAAEGVQAAVRALDRTHLVSLRSALATVVGRTDLVEELLQVVRIRLLVGAPPKIATYRGIGPLGAWLRVVAVRAALDLKRAQGMHRRGLQQFSQHVEHMAPLARSADAEVAESNEMARILVRELTSLDAPNRELLLHHYVSRLSIDVLGAMYGVNRSTVARRVRRTVARLRRGLRLQAATQFGADDAIELDTLSICLDCLDFDLKSVLAGAAPRARGGAAPLRADGARLAAG